MKAGEKTLISIGVEERGRRCTAQQQQKRGRNCAAAAAAISKGVATVTAGRY